MTSISSPEAFVAECQEFWGHFLPSPAVMAGTPTDIMRQWVLSGASYTQFMLALNPHFARTNGGIWTAAAAEATQHFYTAHGEPKFDIKSVLIGGKQIKVEEEIVAEDSFYKLIHFTCGARDAPKILITSPLSGHYATLLRGTVRALLPDHDVYITSWKNARDIPLSAGPFGVDDYIERLISSMHAIGEPASVVAVCESAPKVLVATAAMSEDHDPFTPLGLTLIAGPIDTRINPTVVNKLATERPLAWFEKKLIGTVGSQHPGRGRRVYPGSVQLTAFMTMNLERHQEAYRDLYQHLGTGNSDAAAKIKEFYREYLAVLDLAEKFYIETVRSIFQEHDLPNGRFPFAGRVPNLAAIKVPLLTVEGTKDDVCGLGQTAAAHELCSSVSHHQHVTVDAGHFGAFAGGKFEKEVVPVIRSQVLMTQSAKARSGLLLH